MTTAVVTVGVDPTHTPAGAGDAFRSALPAAWTARPARSESVPAAA